jgi:hypothetical protein
VAVPAAFTVIVAADPQSVVPRNGIDPWLTIAQGCTVVCPAGASLRYVRRTVTVVLPCGAMEASLPMMS